MPGSTSHRVFSDLFKISNIVQQVCVTQGKNLLIDFLRNYFAKDTFFRYETDGWGFPLTPNTTDLPPDIQEKRTTRIFVGNIYRFDIRYLPSITTRHSSAKYYATSINQNAFTTRYRMDLLIDGYGNRSFIRVPTHQVLADAWEQSFELIISSESTQEREELSDIVSSFLIGVARQSLYESGLFIKNVSLGGEREEDWGNKKIYMQSVNIDCFSEWRIEIPVSNVVEMIDFCFNYGIFDSGKFSTDSFFVDVTDVINS